LRVTAGAGGDATGGGGGGVHIFLDTGFPFMPFLLVYVDVNV